MLIIIALIFAVLLTVLITKWELFKKSKFSKITFVYLFATKLLFGIGFYTVYTAYYTDSQTSDMHKYFNDAVKIFELTSTKPLSYLSILTGIEINSEDENITQKLNFWYQEESASVINDSRMIIRFNLLLLPLSRGNIYIHLVAIVFISFIGLSLIYFSLEKFFSGKEMLLLFACFAFPSVMFWSSGIMKEGILIFFLGLLIFNIFNDKAISLIRIIIFATAFIGVFYTKFYVALAIIPSLLFLHLGYIFKNKSNAFILFSTLLICIVSALIFNTMLDNLPLKKLSKKQNDFINLSLGGVYLVNTNFPHDTIFTLKKNSLLPESSLGEGKIVQLKTGCVFHHWKNPGYADTLIAKSNNHNSYIILKVLSPTGSAISLNRLMPNYKSLISLFPAAFINVFFRPFIFDVENLFSLLAFLENIVFILLIISSIFLFERPQYESIKLITFSLLFVFTLYSLVGITTPVLGAAVRYKVPAIPFLLISLFLLYDYSKIKLFVESIFDGIKNVNLMKIKK